MDKTSIAKEIFMNTLGRRIKTKGSFPYGNYTVEFHIIEEDKDPIALAFRLLNEEGEVETLQTNFQEELKYLRLSYFENISFDSPTWNVWFHPNSESTLSDKRIRDLDLKTFVIFCSQMEEEALIIAKQFGEIIKAVECFCLEKESKGKWPV